MSLTTIDRLLRRHNRKKWLAKKRPKQKSEHAKARLEWVIVHKDWTTYVGFPESDLQWRVQRRERASRAATLGFLHTFQEVG